MSKEKQCQGHGLGVRRRSLSPSIFSHYLARGAEQPWALQNRSAHYLCLGITTGLKADRKESTLLSTPRTPQTLLVATVGMTILPARARTGLG